MNVKRRSFIKYSACFWGFSLFSCPVQSVNVQFRLSGEEFNAIKSYIDLLLPEDELPGALSLNAEQVIAKKAKNDAVYAKGVKLGVYWLNYMANKINHSDFVSLPEEQQLKIIVLSEQSQIATLPYLFYRTIRDDVFQYYYAHPAVLSFFYYARPPQPLGFYDFEKPPII